MVRGAQGGIDAEFLGKLIFALLILIVLLWVISATSGGSFTLFDKIAGWFKW